MMVFYNLEITLVGWQKTTQVLPIRKYKKRVAIDYRLKQKRESAET